MRIDALRLDEVTAGMAPEEGWVAIEDVAAHLKVAKESIYRWVDSKGFPAHRVGRLLRFKLSEVDEWVRARACLPRPQRRQGGDDAGSPAPTKGPGPQAPRRGSSRKHRKR
jgi:excisionase family DNA binding protein